MNNRKKKWIWEGEGIQDSKRGCMEPEQKYAK
jgi:hypothetical protein